ncbi:MAG: lycopene beta-cyclase [Candidatus Paceibacteria bacterium]|jgi:lycopene beta-cyclase
MSTDPALLILGGGCAGLSLAMRLAALGRDCPRTVVIEPRTVYGNDRTWCFWGNATAPLADLSCHQWSSMMVRAGRRIAFVDCAAAPYRMIAAADFYAAAQRAIAGNARITMALGEHVAEAPVKQNGRWQVATSSQSYAAETVVDTRPSALPVIGGATLWQSFSGVEIECDGPVFDPACVDLMDFSLADPRRIQFIYVLPLSARRALIEVTVFDAVPLTATDLAESLGQAITARVQGLPYRIQRVEQGILPMGVTARAAPSDPTYVRAGLGNGGARPSSGYAFQRIQRWAGQCATRVATGLPLQGHVADPFLLQAMDQLFLSVLHTQPASAPALFVALFGQRDGARVLRFLSDEGSLADYLALIAALPARPFLQQIPATLQRVLRQRRAAVA